ncbi:FAD-dependent oxidoreductase family protein [Actinidia rufa]|uniref:Glycerol-3-phosphate dehydrogenase n=1 Tax=Actinidia rufa TaxID=165716 RepID=A0A7J0GV83_9ERIC|nr:FAD-dependent oxidoreductase family protein [Actinidia rufa]
MATFICLRRLRATAAAIAFVAGGSYTCLRDPPVSASDRGGPALEAVQRKIAAPFAAVPTRAVQEAALIGASAANPLDVLVVGGGATGCGIALDASTRGLRVGLVEREDFSSGTSSRTHLTNFLGVRYLEKAVFNLDYGQLKLVFHALEERKQVLRMLHTCAMLCRPRLLHLSRYYSAQESVELFPTLARNGKDRTLKGAVVYYDGQMNDSRLNVGLACTAALAGAAVLNHAEVITFLKDEGSERIIGARVRDNLTGMGSTIFWHVIANVNLSIYNIACSTTLHKSAKGFLTPLQ